MECENILFVDTHDKLNFFMETLTNGDKLFQSFIPLAGTKLECYGTSSDVYMDYVEIVNPMNELLQIKFYTYDTPCIEFCKKLSSRFNVNLELYYYNQDCDFSGKIHIHRNQIVRDERYSYFQGIYLNRREEFWELIYPSFDNRLIFMEFVNRTSLHIVGDDFYKLKNLYDEFLFADKFNKAI
jgi:hypothetical protein